MQFISFLASLPRKLWAALAIVAGAVALYIGVRQSGVNAANRKHAEKQRKAADETRNRIEATKPAADVDAARSRLRNRQSK